MHTGLLYLRRAVVISVFVTLAAVAVVCFAGRPPEQTVQSVPGQALTSPGFYKNVEGASKVVLKIEGLSCSGCVDTVNKALSEFKGVHEVFVDLSTGQAEIYYDDKKLKNVGQMAEAITAAGYPAKLDKIIAAGQLKKEMDVMATRSRSYVASVGDLDISRDDLDKELAHAKKGYVKRYGEGIFQTDRGKTLLNSLEAQIVSRLIDERIQLHDIQKAKFVVDKSAVEQEYREFLAKKGMTAEAFEKSLEENGSSFDRFMEKFAFRVLVSQYLDSEILSGTSNEFERQQRYFDWFNNAKLLAKVVFYDKALEQLVQNQSAGCGGGSGGCSGGGCSASRGKK